MGSQSQATLLLQKQLKDLCKNPVDGFSAGLADESNVFEWSVTIIGPPDTLYEGGFFNALMSFPSNYPNSPPSVKFTSEMWHPNVYPDGKVCISILHPPGDDPNGYELASERWSPVHTKYTIEAEGYDKSSGRLHICICWEYWTLWQASQKHQMTRGDWAILKRLGGGKYCFEHNIHAFQS